MVIRRGYAVGYLQLKKGLLELTLNPGAEQLEEPIEAVNDALRKASRRIARLYIGSGVANVDDNTREGT